ncbi:MAG: hypothetical protein ABGY41_17590 [Candidatus Poribacteria bacterium]
MFGRDMDRGLTGRSSVSLDAGPRPVLLDAVSSGNPSGRIGEDRLDDAGGSAVRAFVVIGIRSVW